MSKSGKPIVPAAAPQREYVEAFGEIVARIERSIAAGPARARRPVAMYVAGGAAQLFHTGARVSEDIDASFSHRILLPDDLEVAYVDAGGVARVLYFDRQYNETFALLHEDVHADSQPLAIKGVDPTVIDVRVFAPVDLAVSKIARFAEHDQEDIRALARAGLITEGAVRRRAEEALGNYVGNLDRVRTSIDLAAELVRRNQKTKPARSRRG